MSYTHLAYHIVMGTKERRPFITAPLLPRLRDYLGGIIRQHEGQMLAANGPEDHLHVLAQLSPRYSISDTLRVLKSNVSGWVHRTFPEFRAFGWQDGYAAFSVSRSILPRILKYIEQQQEHHKRMSFREELVRLLEAHGIAYDERYLPA